MHPGTTDASAGLMMLPRLGRTPAPHLWRDDGRVADFLPADLGLGGCVPGRLGRPNGRGVRRPGSGPGDPDAGRRRSPGEVAGGGEGLTRAGDMLVTPLLAAGLGAVMVATAFLSGLFGMAGGLILAGVLLAVLPLPAAMALHAVTQIASNLWRGCYGGATCAGTRRCRMSPGPWRGSQRGRWSATCRASRVPCSCSG